MLKRIFDIIFSVLGIFFLTPCFILIALLIRLEDGNSFLFKQERIGMMKKKFFIYKFRTMRLNSEKQGLLTVGAKDKRVTKIGFYLRKYKLDELPQLFNVLIGDMSFVGPRPEVQKFVSFYNERQLKVLNVRPGITDPASITFRKENEILSTSTSPEELYLLEIMPKKLDINLQYIEKSSLWIDIKIIFRTIMILVNT